MPPIPIPAHDFVAAGDVAAALAHADSHALPDTIEIDDARFLARVRPGEQWQAFDRTDPSSPSRPSGTIKLYDAESFAAAVAQRGEAVVYVDEDAQTMTAILNDDRDGAPGWRDYRVSLTLRPTSEWKAWIAGQGLGTQERFALRIEDGEAEIVEPSAADMLELAQTFHAANEVKFKSVQRLANGMTQLMYDEDIKAAAGTDGKIKIPETFTLGVAPFLGCPPYKVTARLRYKITRQGNNAGQLDIGYKLVRPEGVERDAFRATAVAADDAMPETRFLNGPAPEYTR